ncbi:ABC transporter permease [Persicitalea jodogahamensis]|uniref:ABC transporter permease n=1 Tax=Persicitalea jodogahamensis TaxID=402147 RepID=A0A8J3D4B7_9BACT|nr:ABC transporter permease [Persicitalea jodogahamensis]GHB71157.1 ABC transporter permease [Persicitalea jodogahamensis]
MLLNYLKIAYRNLIRNRVFSLINIVGLGLGIAAFVFILEYVSLEKSVNQFHANLPQMYRVLNEDIEGNSWPEIVPGFAPLAQEKFPEIKEYCRFEEGVAQGVVQNVADNVPFREMDIGYAEGNFFSFFSFPLLHGQAASLAQPNVVFLSESAAHKYFADDDPMGKLLVLNNQFGKTTYTVKGTYADMTDQSDIRYDMVFSLETLRNPANLNTNDWANLDNFDSEYINTFLLLKENADYRKLEAKINALRQEVAEEDTGVKFRLQPAATIHLAASLNESLQTTGNIKYVYMLAGIALLILLIAWFNYVNLSTANSLKRAGEVGVRKSVGATQGNLIGQFLSESLLTNLLGFGLALVLVVSMQPFFVALIGKDVSLEMLGETPVWAYGLGMLLAGTLLSGFYTAWMLSNFEPIETLKGKVTTNTKGIWLRKGLVVGQFVISTCLILATIVIYSQLQYMQNMDLGIQSEQMLVVQGPQIGQDSAIAIRKSAFAGALAQESFVEEYGTSGSVPGRYYNFKTSGFTQPGSRPKDELKAYAFALIGDRYLKTYGIPLVAGRNFTPQEVAVEWNDNSKVLLNERAVAELGFRSPEEALRTKVKWDERYLDVIGVVADYHHTSVQNSIDPIIFYPQNSTSYYSIRLTPDRMGEKMATLEKLYKSSFPGNPFEYFFVDENYQKAYAEERQYSQLFTVASILAIFIACLGLFGLATFTVESRTKEIGVRKVLGASVTSIVTLLSKDFLKLVGVAILVASPVAAYFLKQWLQDFAYRIDIEWWVYGLAAVLAVSIAFITVGYQSIKAGLMNPVDSLRSE